MNKKEYFKLIEPIYLDDPGRAIEILEEYIATREDLDAYFDLAMLYSQTNVFADGPNVSLEILKRILEKDRFNLHALILNASLEYSDLGDIKERTYLLLMESLKQDMDAKIKSGIMLLIALYFDERNVDNKIEYLKKSIALDETSSSNHYILALELKEKNPQLSQHHYKLALENIVKIFHGQEKIDWLDFDKFYNETIRGTDISSQYFEFRFPPKLRKLLKRKDSKIGFNWVRRIFL